MGYHKRISTTQDTWTEWDEREKQLADKFQIYINHMNTPIYAENNGNNTPREQVPAGSHIARCYEMIHIGTVTDQWEGQTKQMNKVRIGFELPEELRTFNSEKGEQPMVISREFTLSMHEKASLRLFLEQWRGKKFTEEEAKKFDVTQLIGVPCMLNVTHTEKQDKVYANISSVSPVHKSLVVPDAINPIRVLSYENFDWEVYESLPDFIKTKMSNTPEYGRVVSEKIAREKAVAGKTHGQPVQPMAPPVSDDDLPF